MRFLKFVVSAAAVVWLVTAIDWAAIIGAMGEVRWPLLAAAVGLNALLLIICARRWQAVASANDYPLSLGESIQGYFVGSFFTAFLPTGKGGDVVRAFLVAARKGYSSGGLLGTVLVERFVGFLVTLTVLAGFGLFWFARLSPLKNAAVLAAGLLAALLALLFLVAPVTRFLERLVRKVPWPWVQRFAGDFIRVLERTVRKPRLLGTVVVLSAANQLFNAGLAGLVGAAIPGFQAPWYAFVIVTLLVFVVVLLPSVGGHGVRETGYVAFFGWFSVDAQSAGLFAILNLLLVIGNALIGFFIFLFWKKTRTSSAAQASTRGRDSRLG
jgi:uncharacterized membrane protein YbhN (UPF0104 family)